MYNDVTAPGHQQDTRHKTQDTTNVSLGSEHSISKICFHSIIESGLRSRDCSPYCERHTAHYIICRVAERELPERVYDCKFKFMIFEI